MEKRKGASGGVIQRILAQRNRGTKPDNSWELPKYDKIKPDKMTVGKMIPKWGNKYTEWGNKTTNQKQKTKNNVQKKLAR